jgi:hypothetical protein
MPHQIPLAKNSSTNKFQELKVDANGKLEVSDSVVNLNTDTLEAKLDTQINGSIRGINNTASIGDGSENHTSVALGYDRSNGKGRALLVDADGHLQCDILSGGGGDATAANQVNMDTKLLDIKNAVELLDNCITSGNELQCDIVSSALPTDASTATLQGTIVGHLDGVEGELNNIDTAIDAMSAKLPASLGQKANSNCLATCRSSTTGAYDLSARTTIATAGTSKKLLCDGDGKLVVKISSASDTHNVKLEDLTSNLNAHNSNSGGGSGRSLCVSLKGRTDITSHDTADAKFLLCDSAGKLAVNSSVITTGADWVSSESVANGNLNSTHLDIDGARAVQIFGDTGTTSVSGGGLQIHGSNNNSNYFSLHSQIDNSSPLALYQNQVGSDYHQFGYVKNPPRYLKIYNNSGGTVSLTLKVSTQ